MAPARGLLLTGCPAIDVMTALRAASARPVVEKTSAISAMIVAGDGLRTLTAPVWGHAR